MNNMSNLVRDLALQCGATTCSGYVIVDRKTMFSRDAGLNTCNLDVQKFAELIAKSVTEEKS